MKILVVDDDVGILELLKEVLTRTGFHDVRTVSSAKAAIDSIANLDGEYDCFLVDIQMPDVDGIALVDIIRKTPGYGRKPVIMLTAMGEKPYLDRAFSAGATDYITKPFDLEELRTRISDAGKLAHQKFQMEGRPFVEGEFRQSGRGLKETRLSDPIVLHEIETAIAYHAFENYLVQLAQSRTFKAVTFAIKILEIERLYEDCSQDEFLTCVEAAARAIKQELLSERGSISYRGDGTFICIEEKKPSVPLPRLESVLAERIQLLCSERGIPAFKMVVGGQVPLKNGPERMVLENISLAIELVEEKYTAKKDLVTLAKRFLIRRRMSPDQRRLEQKVYQGLLKELLPAGDNDSWNRQLLDRE